MKNKIKGIIPVMVLGAILFTSCDKALVDPAESDLLTEVNITSPFSSQQLAQEGNADGVVEGEYILLFNDNQVPNDFASDVEALGGNVIYQHKTGFAYIGGISEEGAEQLQTRLDITNIAANASYSLNLPAEPQTSMEAAVLSPNDPTAAFFFSRQWNLLAVGADVAWDAGYLGDEDITVAILDTGIDYGHPDLAGRVDLSRSISFVPADDAAVDVNFPGRHYVTDLDYHGTHVAATVASNAFAAAGVTSKTTLTGIKVCSVFPRSCSFGAIMSGLLHAADTGVDIANMSLGGAFSKALNGEFVGIINRTMNYVRSSGVTVVVSAGNNAANIDNIGNIYKTYCDSPNVICVSATGPTTGSTNGPWTDVDALAPYSNYGRSAIDVAAPGGTREGRVWAACSQTSLVLPFCKDGTFVIGITGTSMASPHVAGLAALIASQGITHPAQIKAKILQSADDLGQPGTDPYYGKGRINVANAMGL